ncbi:unnamed protein product [Ceutorhynchus assimilis]|uniref:Retinoblastoma-like protein 1 n=1 Tax=Ceutorhynchus assimilis TaxID=467358 RepID=A0A9N9MCI1_9CUCU|nr:unnamed protein product [Ceutorhynchus assimilis]
MVLSNSSEEELKKTHQELCNKLNLDQEVAATAWDTFESISKKFVLEGEKLHWLGCAIYSTSRNVEQKSSKQIRGNGINLTSLLRHSNLSFVQFFTNITRWSEMTQLPDEFRNKINHLRVNFSTASNTFKKLHPLFTEIFVEPAPNALDLDALKHKGRRNMRPIPCTPLKILEFIWNLFVTIKIDEPTCRSEIIKAHHLLFCCIDLVFQNVVAAEMRDLINPSLSEELLEQGAVNNEVPCIVKKFCKHDLLIKEALHMKVYIFRPLITKLISNSILIADENDFTGIFNGDNFEQNFRNITKTYETHLLNYGDFDERIFLAEFKRITMEREQSWTSMKVLPPGDSTDTLLLESPKVGGGSGAARGFDTPLTGRKFLGPREGDTLIRSASEKIARLHTMIGDRVAGPSNKLKEIFESCQRNPLTKIQENLSTMKEKFIETYTSTGYSIEEAQNRSDLGFMLFYKYVELILAKEKEITANISALVEKEIFYQCMFACCLEIVLYCHNFPRKFPWILDVLAVPPIHFVKVIELIVRTKDNLFRELIKHLNRIEETVIESLMWKSNSPIWDAIEKSGQGIPKFQDTALPGHLLYNDMSNEHLLQSPGPQSATDCFQSPLSQICKPLLFPSAGNLQSHLILPDKDGKMKLIPIVQKPSIENQQSSPGARPDPQAAALPRRTGSVSIIFRKFYNLAGVRMQHLCSHLGFEDFELRRKIWTIFEDSIRHTDLIKDRHLDQLLMCAIYVICKAAKITNMPNLFAIIMKFYRQQPQSSSLVYRDVLIERKKTNDDGDFIDEERGDLIQFYNLVYVKEMQTYAIRFQPNTNPNNNVPLSPLPASQKKLMSSNLRVVGNVFVKPLETSSTPPGSTFNYYFSRSPSKDLMNINSAINNMIQGKRLINDNGTMPSAKRISNRKIQSLMEDRQRHNASE